MNMDNCHHTGSTVKCTLNGKYVSTRAVNWDLRVQGLAQGLAGPGWTRESESTTNRTRGLAKTPLKLRSPSIRLASPRVPASPREASPQVQKVGLLSALVSTLLPSMESYCKTGNFRVAIFAKVGGFAKISCREKVVLYVMNIPTPRIREIFLS